MSLLSFNTKKAETSIKLIYALRFSFLLIYKGFLYINSILVKYYIPIVIYK